MSRNVIKQILQYSFSLAVAIGILWYVLRDVQLEEMLEKAALLNYSWVGVSLVFAFIAYLLRAWRWNLLLAPLGYRPPLGSTFIALMIGYLANLVLPRLGEVARCGVLKRDEEIPLSASLGTVLAERVIDLLFLILIVVGTLLLEFDELQSFLTEIFTGGESRLPSAQVWLAMLAGLAVITLGLWLLYRGYKNQIHNHALFIKVQHFVKELLAGLLSVRSLKNPVGFWLSSVFIWVMYYLMSYVIVFSLPQTSGIDLMAGFSILAMGGIGMAAPVQGGLGTYHLLVSGVLMVYGATKSDAILLAFVLHTSQTLFVIFTGIFSLGASFLRNRKKSLISVEHGETSYKQ